MPADRLARLAWASLAYTVAVIAFGAVVRATGSGDGCGANWPTCDGEIVAFSGSAETVIEFVHRFTSGLALVPVVILTVAVWRRRSARGLRVVAIASLVLIVNEAIIGGALARFELTGENDSIVRAVVIGAHLVNTFFLLGCLTATAWWLSGGAIPSRPFSPDRRSIGIATAALLVVAAAGAVTALGDTLFPPESIADGIFDDVSGRSFLVRLRWIHPLVAVFTGLYVVRLARNLPLRGPGRRVGPAVAVLAVTQLGLGALNVALSAPLWMQLVHLVVADTLWVGFVIMSIEGLGTSIPARPQVVAA